MKNSLRDERGVVLVLVAMFALVIMGVFSYFYYFVPLTKTITTTVRLKTEEICYQISESPVMGAEARDQFFALVNQVNVPNFEMQRVVLYFNEMLEGEAFDKRDYTIALEGGELDDTVAAPVTISVPSPECPTNSACFISGTVGFNDGNRISYRRLPAGTLTDPFDPALPPDAVPVPERMALRSYYSGNFFGCEIIGRPRFNSLPNFISDFFAPRVEARVFMQQVPKSFRAEEFEPNLDTFAGTNFNETLPKLTVIIDPYLQTRMSEGRHTPPTGFTNVAGGGVVGGGVFSESYPPYPDVNGNTDAPVLFQDNVDINLDGAADERINRYPINSSAWTANQQVERLLACYNAPSIVRNAFLYQFLSFIVRDGMFRGNTSIYLTNPKHRAYFGTQAGVTPTDAHHYHPGILNPPTGIFGDFPPLGRDLLDRSAQIPFLNFFGTTQGNGPFIAPEAFQDTDNTLSSPEITAMGSVQSLAPYSPNFQYSQAFTQPFYADGGTNSHSIGNITTPFGVRNENLMQYHSLVSGQLRDCSGLYDGGPNIPLDEIWLNESLNQRDLWTPSGLDDSDSQTMIAGGLKSSIWDLNIPPASYLVQDPTANGTNPDQLLNALQFVSALGAAQSCPIATEGLTTMGGYCGKPSTKEFDLKGDVFAAIAHLAREDKFALYEASGPSGRAPGPVPAISHRPGVFYHSTPFVPPTDADQLLKPYGTANYFVRPDAANCNEYGSANCTDSFTGAVPMDELTNPPPGDQYIVIVTHQAPTEQEIDLWQRFLTGEYTTDPGITPNFELTAPPLFESLANENILIVYVDVNSESHTDADDAYSRWYRAIYGDAGAATGLIGTDPTNPTTSNFLQSRRQILFLSPFGEQRFGITAGQLATECAGPEPVESCDYVGLAPDDAYQQFYSDLLDGTSASPGANFAGNIRDRAILALKWMKKVRIVF